MIESRKKLKNPVKCQSSEIHVHLWEHLKLRKIKENQTETWQKKAFPFGFCMKK